MTRKIFLILLALMLALSAGLVACGAEIGQEEEEEEGYAVLEVGEPGVSLQDDRTLLYAIGIRNSGTTAAQSVQLTAITLNGATLTSPASLPFDLGAITEGYEAVLNADFSGGPFSPGESYVLTLQGTYEVDAATYNFTLPSDLVIPPAAPGSEVANSIRVDANSVSGGEYPAQEPIGYERANPGAPPVPTAPFVPGTPTPNETEVTMAELSALSTVALNSPPPIEFLANNGLVLTTDVVSTTAEPSGASGGGVVFLTVNWRAAFSTDDGNTWTQLNPTTVFPADTVGFCCDQIVQYVPSIDRFIWLLQGNGYRLASASPADIINSQGTAWTYWNLTPGVFGSCGGFDYPDLSLGDNYLYMSWDAGWGCTSGFQVARTSLSGIQAGGTITIGFTDPANAPSSIVWGSHLTQNTGNEIFWAGHNGNNKLRVYSWAESSNTYYWRDVGISSWANNQPTSYTPDEKDWLCKNFNGCTGGGAFPRNGIIGAARSGNQVWFAWTAGTSHFTQAHIEMVTLDRNNNFSKIQQVQIWNNNYAFGYPSLASNACTGEIGLSFECGGNGYYENHVFGFWGDFLVYQTTGSDVGTWRFGDYVTVRRRPPTEDNPGNLFDAFGYGLNTGPGGDTQVDIHHVVFGRPASWCG